MSYGLRVELSVRGEVWFWRGPSPFHFVTVPDAPSRRIRERRAAVTYGWGMIPVTARVGTTEWTTSLFPKDGRYVIPLKTWVRDAEGIELGDTVTVHLSIDA